MNMDTQTRFIEVGREAEGIDQRTEKIIQDWQNEGYRQVQQVEIGGGRRHLIFDKTGD